MIRTLATALLLCLADATFAQTQPAASNAPSAVAPPQKTQRDTAGAQDHQPHAETIRRPLPGSNPAFNGPAQHASDPRLNEDGQKAQANVRDEPNGEGWAAWLAALAALITAVIAYVQMTFFRRQLELLGDQIEDTKMSIDIAERALQAQDRPWIHVEMGGKCLNFHEGPHHAFLDPEEKERPCILDLTVQLANVGKSVAAVEAIEFHRSPYRAHELQEEVYFDLLPNGIRVYNDPRITFYITPDSRMIYLTRPPSLRGWLQYRSIQGVTYKQHFSFRPRITRETEDWVRQGGSSENYEEEVK
jgi:hypothetical protein